MQRNDLKKPEIIGIGITGFVGSRIIELLGDKYKFSNLSLETGVDITNPTTLEVLKKHGDKAIVIHLAAKADVDACEKDRKDGKQSDAWKINVLGTQNVIDACKEKRLKIIYISTDFVFDGESLTDGGYNENDVPRPTNFYAETKYQAEKMVRSSGLPFIIMRIAYPYRAKFEGKKDFMHVMAELLEKGRHIEAVTDHVMTPTFIDDIAWAIDKLIEKNSAGIYHVVGSQFVTPYEAAVLIARTFSFDQFLIDKTIRRKFFAGRAPRPFRLALNNDKIEKLGLKMKSFKQGLEEIKKQGFN